MNNCDSIEILRTQFFCCTSLNKFKWPDILDYADENIQKQIINKTINDEIILKYPVKQSYKKAFLKILMHKLEKSGVEITDDIYTAYCDTVSSPDEGTTMCYKHFILNCQSISYLLSIKESTNIISEGTTGLCSWNAAFYLAEWCISNKQKILGKNILELGSGVGLTGLTVINFCEPKSYYFSDCHPLVLKTLEENIRLNLIEEKKDNSWKEMLNSDKLEFENSNKAYSTKIFIENLNWEEIKSKVGQIPVELVIAADILYDSSNFEALASGLKELIYNSVEYAIVVATIRNESTVEKFLNILDEYKLSVKEEDAVKSHTFLLSEETPVRILKISKHLS